MQMVLEIALDVKHIRPRRKGALIGAIAPATLARPGIMARPAFYANRAATKQPLAANLVLIVNLASTQKTVGRQCAAAAKQEHSRHKMAPRQQVLAPIARHRRRRQRAARPALIVSATQAQLGLMAGTARAVMRASSSRSRARMLVASVSQARSRYKMAPRQQVLAPIARHRRRRQRAARPALIVSATQAQLGLMAGTARAVMRASSSRSRARMLVASARPILIRRRAVTAYQPARAMLVQRAMMEVLVNHVKPASSRWTEAMRCAQSAILIAFLLLLDRNQKATV